jgi:hypothetical protein
MNSDLGVALSHKLPQVTYGQSFPLPPLPHLGGEGFVLMAYSLHCWFGFSTDTVSVPAFSFKSYENAWLPINLILTPG